MTDDARRHQRLLSWGAPRPPTFTPHETVETLERAFERLAAQDVLVVRKLCRLEMQRAVGRTPLRDVLLSLKRAGLIRRFRLTVKTVEVHAPRTLPFLFDTTDA